MPTNHSIQVPIVNGMHHPDPCQDAHCQLICCGEVAVEWAIGRGIATQTAPGTRIITL